MKRKITDIKIEVVGKPDINGLSSGERSVFFDSLLNRLKEVTNNQNGGQTMDIKQAKIYYDGGHYIATATRFTTICFPVLSRRIYSIR